VCGPAEIGEGKLFAPGNLRATFDNPAYERLISHYLGEKYTLRSAHIPR
jgi:sedoheptulose-bisphosphatase